MIYCDEIEQYIKFVEENPKETDDEIKLLIKNIVKPTLLRDDVFFDENTFRNAVRYCEKWYYKLFPYQKFAYALFFMYDKNNTDIVIFPEILILMARGNGKDGMIMPLANFLQTHYYGVKNYNIDIVATSEEQALNSFNVVYNMLESNKKVMRKYFYWNKTEIINRQTKSKLRYNTANAKTKDGKQTGMIIFNEFHAYENYKLINVYSSGLGKIKHSRTVIITTNGIIRDGPLDEKLATAKLILNGEENFLGLLPIIYKIKDKKTVDKPMEKFLKTKNKSDIDITEWVQANPSLRYMPVLMNELIRDYLKMLQTPSYRTEFYAKRMNLPEQDTEDAVTEWGKILKASYQDVENKIPRETKIIQGQACVCGIDFADLNDLATAGLLFKQENGEYVWRCKTWICANGRDFKNMNFPFDQIGIEGYTDFEIVYTNTINGEDIVKWVVEQSQVYNILKIVMDNFRAGLLRGFFEEYGISIETKENKSGLVRTIRYPASIAAIVAPEIDILFSEGLINIGNSAIMRWAINNTAVQIKKDGNKLYVKINPKLRKNDPFMAYVCAMSVKGLLDIMKNVEIVGAISF